MSNQGGIFEWSKLYGRQISEREYEEICYNLNGFFMTLNEWDKEDRKSGESDKNT